jgi:hypothetical protein
MSYEIIPGLVKESAGIASMIGRGIGAGMNAIRKVPGAQSIITGGGQMAKGVGTFGKGLRNAGAAGLKAPDVQSAINAGARIGSKVKPRAYRQMRSGAQSIGRGVKQFAGAHPIASGVAAGMGGSALIGAAQNPRPGTSRLGNAARFGVGGPILGSYM